MGCIEGRPSTSPTPPSETDPKTKTEMTSKSGEGEKVVQQSLKGQLPGTPLGLSQPNVRVSPKKLNCRHQTIKQNETEGNCTKSGLVGGEEFHGDNTQTGATSKPDGGEEESRPATSRRLSEVEVGVASIEGRHSTSPSPPTEAKGQKMKITRRVMRQRRKRVEHRDWDWLEDDLDLMVSSKDVDNSDIQDWTLPMVLIGSDVAALYPSLVADLVGKTVYAAVMESDIKWEGIDYCEAVRYIALNTSAEESNRSRLRMILPRRRWKTGSRPCVKGVGPQGPGRGDTEQWVFPEGVTLTDRERKMTVATVIKIGVEKMMNTHIYTFGDKFYLQKKGGPIGLRSTCAAARVVMSAWDVKWQQRVMDVNICLEDALRYMDDSRAAILHYTR